MSNDYRTNIKEALDAWEAKGPTSLTVALIADALYGAREAIDASLTICGQVEANPVGWGGDMAVSLARSVRAALTTTTPAETTGGAR